MLKVKKLYMERGGSIATYLNDGVKVVVSDLDGIQEVLEARENYGIPVVTVF